MADMPVRTLQECLDEFVAERPLQPDEYPDIVSGLAYCKRCHSPRRIRQVLFRKERILPIESSGTNGNKQRQNFSPKTQTPKNV